jgi:hypothetical protein
MARPEKPIDWKQFEFLALTPNSTQQSIADALGVHRDTLSDRFKQEYGMDFSAYSTLRKQCGRTLFESQQLQKAFKGSAQMLIYLGKVWYGQKEAESKSTEVANDQHLDEKFSLLKLNFELNERLKTLEAQINADKPKADS